MQTRACRQGHADKGMRTRAYEHLYELLKTNDVALKALSMHVLKQGRLHQTREMPSSKATMCTASRRA
eukprot:1161036-Pelagomonas_calceolata.AAC.6